MEPGDLATLMGEVLRRHLAAVTARKGLVMGRAGDSVMCVWPGSRTDSRDSGLSERARSANRTADQRARENACQAALESERPSAALTARHATPLRTRLDCTAARLRWEALAVSTTSSATCRIRRRGSKDSTKRLGRQFSRRNWWSRRAALHALLRRLGRFSSCGGQASCRLSRFLAGWRHVAPQTQKRCHRFAAALAVSSTGDLSRAGQMFEVIAMTTAGRARRAIISASARVTPRFPRRPAFLPLFRSNRSKPVCPQLRTFAPFPDEAVSRTA